MILLTQYQDRNTETCMIATSITHQMAKYMQGLERSTVDVVAVTIFG